MPKHYKGIIVGGPKAGRWLASDEPSFAINELPDFKPEVQIAFSSYMEEAPVTARVVRHIYRHRDYNGTTMWVPVDWSPDQVVAELARGYHPVV